MLPLATTPSFATLARSPLLTERTDTTRSTTGSTTGATPGANAPATTATPVPSSNDAVVRPAVDLAARSASRRVGVGREEMLRQNIERGMASRASVAAPRVSTVTTAGVEALGQHGKAIARIADDLRAAGLVNAAEHAELKNGVVGVDDVRIGGKAIDRVQATTPGAATLMVEALQLQNHVTSLQSETLRQDLETLGDARAARVQRSTSSLRQAR